MSMIIRREQTADIAAIDEVTVAAFVNAAHSDHCEQFIVKALRQAAALSVSLVAEENGTVVGHVALSPVTITDGSDAWYGLGPISVLPAYQHQGIGSQLMHAALQQLKQLGANGCVVLGDPNYYQRFGFAAKAGLLLPEIPPEYFQALLLQGQLPQGAVSYHPAFNAKS